MTRPVGDHRWRVRGLIPKYLLASIPAVLKLARRFIRKLYGRYLR
jgi:hypothetical protein